MLSPVAQAAPCGHQPHVPFLQLVNVTPSDINEAGDICQWPTSVVRGSYTPRAGGYGWASCPSVVLGFICDSTLGTVALTSVWIRRCDVGVSYIAREDE